SRRQLVGHCAAALRVDRGLRRVERRATQDRGADARRPRCRARDRLRFARSRCEAAVSHARIGATQDRVSAYDAHMPKTPASANADGFAALGLDARLVAALTALGYEEPTPIQGQTIRPLIEGRD